VLGRVLAQLRNQWIGVLALLIAIGTGSAYAANTVFSSDIVDGEVKTADLANNAVRTTKIANKQIQSIDIKELSEFSEAASANGQCGADDQTSTFAAGRLPYRASGPAAAQRDR
jgi:hypothetical protein